MKEAYTDMGTRKTTYPYTTIHLITLNNREETHTEQTLTPRPNPSPMDVSVSFCDTVKRCDSILPNCNSEKQKDIVRGPPRAQALPGLEEAAAAGSAGGHAEEAGRGLSGPYTDES
ncbi:unnamed protein product [Caretta caretta]